MYNNRYLLLNDNINKLHNYKSSGGVEPLTPPCIYVPDKIIHETIKFVYNNILTFRVIKTKSQNYPNNPVHDIRFYWYSNYTVLTEK